MSHLYWRCDNSHPAAHRNVWEWSPILLQSPSVQPRQNKEHYGTGVDGQYNPRLNLSHPEEEKWVCLWNGHKHISWPNLFICTYRFTSSWNMFCRFLRAVMLFCLASWLSSASGDWKYFIRSCRLHVTISVGRLTEGRFPCWLTPSSFLQKMFKEHSNKS